MPPATDETVSVAICTRNRSDQIGQAIESVLASDRREFDLTVIDQSTDDATQQVVEKIASRDPRVRYVKMDGSGLSRAYNLAITSTSGDILAFTDDDCLVPGDWLDNIVAAFHDDPDADLLYGQVEPAFPEGDGFRLTPYVMVEEPERMVKGSGGYRVFGMGANYAARRRLFDRIGMFDEILGGGGPLKSSQDHDLMYRAYQGGCVTVLRPEVVLRHDGRREDADWPTLMRAYGTGDGAFFTKHVRCRDPYAAWLLLQRMVYVPAKVLAKTVLRRRGAQNNWAYAKGLFVGARDSFKFGVDRDRRLYVERD